MKICKNNLIIFLALAVLCLTASCETPNLESSEISYAFTQSEQQIEKNIIYVDSDEGQSTKLPHTDDIILYAADPNQFGEEQIAPFVDETAILQRSLKIQDQNYKLQYKYTDALEDAYCTESGEYYYYFRGTDTLRFFCRTLTFDEMNIKITKEEAAKAAEAFMKTVLTEEYFSEYTVCSVSDLKDTLYVISYEKCVHGVPTYDCPTVWITESGEIYAFNGHEMLSCHDLEEAVSAEDVTNACQIISDYVEQVEKPNWKYSDPVICMDNAGKAYIQVYASYTGINEIPHAVILYTPIAQ